MWWSYGQELGVLFFDSQCSYSIEKQFFRHEADYDGLNLYLSEVDSYGMLSVNLSPNDLWSALRDKIYEAATLFVPTTNYVSTVAKQSRRKPYQKHAHTLNGN